MINIPPPLTIIIGPQGSGKSTLVSEILAGQPHKYFDTFDDIRASYMPYNGIAIVEFEHGLSWTRIGDYSTLSSFYRKGLPMQRPDTIIIVQAGTIPQWAAESTGRRNWVIIDLTKKAPAHK